MPLSDEAKADIAAVREIQTTTRRATVPALEEVLFEPIAALDHGFVRVVDYMGDDAAIVQAARVSYGAGTKSVRNDAGLINYLMAHRHSTPFEMCEIKLHVKLPMFVARQWIRHRTANVNEYSARYSILDREFYVPEPELLALQSQSNRQGRGETLDPEAALKVRGTIADHGARSFELYRDLLGGDTDDGAGDAGIARELARMVLPLNTYTQWYWKIDLHNLLHFIALRADAHAQYEIRVYAAILTDLVERWVPQTYAAFVHNRLGGAALSKGQLDVIRRQLKGESVTAETSGLSAREWRELAAVLAAE